ncbi:early nodulin-like protein 18 [Salvia miltiorrhiza]|uniref:early nodulin-like protein 18 n=1 Tax=Salvia miltiorrhiza TaxID=226208 RepID=UPI0025AC66AC|nr:early nodulin-like protein 18 [Salvia miltiorrhiza]
MAATKAAPLRLIAAALLVTAAAAADAYTNHTVGGDAGWFFDSTANKTSADYAAWAANTTFNLGDYLIFNTNTNQTVIQTFNKTTYGSCITDDALDSDTFQYDGGSNEFGSAMTIGVALTIEGTQYYFSDADDGEQCQHGMAFEIKVGHGLGLPPSLNQPPPPAYVPPPGEDEGQSPPATVANTPPTSSNHATMAGASFLASALLLVLISFVGC